MPYTHSKGLVLVDPSHPALLPRDRHSPSTHHKFRNRGPAIQDLTHLSLVLVLAAGVALAPTRAMAADIAGATADELQAYYKELRTVTLDAEKVGRAENVVLKRDAGEFTLKAGTVVLFRPVGGRVFGAIFEGSGVFKMDPPIEIEALQLARFNGGKSTLEEPLERLLMLFSDETAAELDRSVKFTAGPVPGESAKMLERFRSRTRKDWRSNVEVELLGSVANRMPGNFTAWIDGTKQGDFLFDIDRADDEEVSLVHFKGSRSFDVWSSFSLKERYANGVPLFDEGKVLVDTIRSDMDVTIAKSTELSAVVEMEFQPLRDSLRMIPFRLLGDLRVSKVADGTGAALAFVQEDKDEDSDLWVILPHAPPRGESHKVHFEYAGKDVVQKAGTGNYFVGARSSWYPTVSHPGEVFSDRAMHKMKFKVPKGMTLVATGKVVTPAKDEKDFNLSEWETPVPYTVVGFNYGRFKVTEQKNGPFTVKVYTNPDLGDELRPLQIALESDRALEAKLGLSAGHLNTTGMAGAAAAEGLNSVSVYTRYFGEIPSQPVAVTQQPAGYFGQSWPSLVFMPYTAFLSQQVRQALFSTDTKQFLNEVGSHEVAHQWWGHLVCWTTYHDQWLSEGFAEFSAGLYTQVIDGQKKYEALLRRNKEGIFSKEPDGERRNDIGPIWLGQRLSSEKTPGGSRLMYDKGALVLHMLRMMLYDWGGGGDTHFAAMMQDYVKTYAGKTAGTAEFATIVSKHFGQDMGWFFGQWVLGTGLPRFKVRYGYEQKDGQTELVIDYERSGVPESFMVQMPVRLKFEKRAATARIWLNKEREQIRLKIPQIPNDVVFNPAESVLCELDVRKI